VVHIFCIQLHISKSIYMFRDSKWRYKPKLMMPLNKMKPNCSTSMTVHFGQVCQHTYNRNLFHQSEMYPKKYNLYESDRFWWSVLIDCSKEKAHGAPIHYLLQRWSTKNSCILIGLNWFKSHKPEKASPHENGADILT
jgi:hypothetical protein